MAKIVAMSVFDFPAAAQSRIFNWMGDSSFIILCSSMDLVSHKPRDCAFTIAAFAMIEAHFKIIKLGGMCRSEQRIKPLKSPGATESGIISPLQMLCDYSSSRKASCSGTCSSSAECQKNGVCWQEALSIFGSVI